MFLYPLFTADLESVGKFDFDSVPTQVLLEGMISEIESPARFMSAEDDYLPYDQWYGIDVDHKGKVTDIDWSGGPGQVFNRGGFLSLHYMPRTVRYFYAFDNRVEGTLDTHALPRDLIEIDISTNNFSGTLDLAQLPEKIQLFSVASNQFIGSVYLVELPKTLLSLNVSRNRFSGTISLISLPDALEYLTLNDNFFEQDNLPCGVLPHRLMKIIAKGNKISKLVNADGECFSHEKIVI